MYRFALRPLWLLGHLLAAALVVLMVSLGFWQLSRLDERKEHNALVAKRSETVVPLPVEGWANKAKAANLSFRRVRLSGRYEPAKEVLVRFRSNQGLPGYHVLTPMATSGGTIIVNRGWVPLAMGNSWPNPGSRPPDGDTAITGLLRSSEPARRFSPDGPRAGAPLSVGAVNIAGLERRLSTPLYPLYLELAPPKPGATPASYPEALPAPKLDEGPHLAYAAQWFLFAGGAAAGWVLLLRISARKRRLTDVQEEPLGGSPSATVEPQGR
ncbi:MAG TPA: SURF1 family protein [Acidimicrobiales bacterium]|nr:SURF1 family protein [Acidimicrobiales bacterium]